MREILIVVGFLFLGGAAQAQSVPVMVGGEREWDACGMVGKVVNLDPHGDNFLSLRAGPGGKYRELTRLGPQETHLYLCDERGPWLGIVLGPGSREPGCGVMGPVYPRQAYRGTCMSGWVHRRYVEAWAG